MDVQNKKRAMNNEKNSTLGFTLIELLVVVSVIGMVASIVLAAVNKARLQAKDLKKKNDLKVMSQAIDLYYQEHGSFFTNGSQVYVIDNLDPLWTTELGGSLQQYMPSLPKITSSSDYYRFIATKMGQRSLAASPPNHFCFLVPVNSYILYTMLSDPDNNDIAPGNIFYAVKGGNTFVSYRSMTAPPDPFNCP